MANNFINLLSQSSYETEFLVVIIVIEGIIAFLALYLSIHYLVQKHTNKVLLEKVLNNPESIIRSATFVKSKYLFGIAQPMKGTARRSSVSYHYIYVKYVGDNGFEKIVRVNHMISDYDLRYVKCLETIKIKTYKNLVAISEDLSNPEITDEMLIRVRLKTGDTSHIKPPYYISTTTGKFMIGLASVFCLGALGVGIAQIVFAVQNPDNHIYFILTASFCFVMSAAACFVLFIMLRDVIVDNFGSFHIGTLQSVRQEYKDGHVSISEKVAYVLIDGKSEKVVLESNEEFVFLAHYVGKNIAVRKVGRKIAIDYDSLGVNPNDLP